jgi:Mn-dependent DtxR family transcriptional regulator
LGVTELNDKEKDFYTIRGYERLRQEDKSVTPTMEDYLEMIYRLSKDRGFTRIGDLAGALHVQPPSASKMVQKLAEASFLNYEKYGVIELTGQGRELGEYLVKRHETIERFLRFIGATRSVLEETEKIEHNLSTETVKQIMLLVQFMEENQQWMEAFTAYKQSLV